MDRGAHGFEGHSIDTHTKEYEGTQHQHSGTMIELIAAIAGSAVLLVLLAAAIGRRRPGIHGPSTEPDSVAFPGWASGRRRATRSAVVPASAVLCAISSANTTAADQPSIPATNQLSEPPSDGAGDDVGGRLRHAHPVSSARPASADASPGSVSSVVPASTFVPSGPMTPQRAAPSGFRRRLPLRRAKRSGTAGPTAAKTDDLAATEHLPQRLGARRATVDIMVQVVGRLGNLVLGVGVTLVLVHSLGARGFGEWSTILAITQIVINFGDLGLNTVAIARAVAEPERERAWLGALVSLRVTLAVPMTIGTIAGVLAILAGNARVAGLVMAATMLVGASGSVSAVFQLRVRNDISTAILTFQSVFWLAGVIVVSAAGGDIRAFAAVFLLTNALMTVLTVAFAQRMMRPQLARAWRLWRPLLRVGLGVGAAGILVTIYVRLDQILVFEYAGSRQAGLYGAAYRILDQAQFIPLSVMTTLFPLIAASYATDAVRVRRLLQLTAEYLSMGSFGALAFTIIAARPIMVLLFGPQFAPAAPALPILMGAFVSISFGYLVGNMVVILELQRRFLLYTAVALVLNVVLNVLLIPTYGFQAAAWVTLATEVTVMSLSARSVLKRLEMKPSWMRLGRVAAAAAGMGLVVETASQAGLPLGALVAIAAVLYPALLLASRAVTLSSLAVLIRRDAML